MSIVRTFARHQGHSESRAMSGRWRGSVHAHRRSGVMPSHPDGTRPGLLIISARYPATSATIPLDIHHLQHVGDKVIVETRHEGVQANEDTRVNETCPGHTRCTYLSVTSTCLELCGPGADRSLSLWHVVVIVGPDDDMRAHALGRCRASCGLLRL